VWANEERGRRRRQSRWRKQGASVEARAGRGGQGVEGQRGSRPAAKQHEGGRGRRERWCRQRVEEKDPGGYRCLLGTASCTAVGCRLRGQKEEEEEGARPVGWAGMAGIPGGPAWQLICWAGAGAQGHGQPWALNRQFVACWLECWPAGLPACSTARPDHAGHGGHGGPGRSVALDGGIALVTSSRAALVQRVAVHAAAPCSARHVCVCVVVLICCSARVSSSADGSADADADAAAARQPSSAVSWGRVANQQGGAGLGERCTVPSPRAPPDRLLPRTNAAPSPTSLLYPCPLAMSPCLHVQPRKTDARLRQCQCQCHCQCQSSSATFLRLTLCCILAPAPS
jgi:hypothetical protein